MISCSFHVAFRDAPEGEFLEVKIEEDGSGTGRSAIFRYPMFWLLTSESWDLLRVWSVPGQRGTVETYIACTSATPGHLREREKQKNARGSGSTRRQAATPKRCPKSSSTRRWSSSVSSVPIATSYLGQKKRRAVGSRGGKCMCLEMGEPKH